MREQGGGMLFSPLIERKKASLKISGREDSNESRRRLNDGYVSYLSGKSIANMPGSRLKGGSSIQDFKNHERENGLPEQLPLEKTKESLESEPQKRKSVEDGLLPQWGHGKRSRCSRLEQSKHATYESAFPVKKAIRLERRTEKQSAGGVQANGITKLRGQGVLSPGTPFVRETAPGVVGRNACSPARPIATETVADEGQAAASSSPEKACDGVPLVCRQSSPQERITITAPCNGGRGGPKVVPFSSEEPLLFPPAWHLAQQPLEIDKGVDLECFEWPRIFIGLSRKEKEDDFLILKGTKLPQRPKRRPKAVEKALHYCTPGNWLSDLARSRYDVREKKSVKKKPRGLKAMESKESDSE